MARPRLSQSGPAVLLGVRVPREWREALEELADTKNPLPELLREAIKRFLQSSGRLRNPVRKEQRASARVPGRFKEAEDAAHRVLRKTAVDHHPGCTCALCRSRRTES